MVLLPCMKAAASPRIANVFDINLTKEIYSIIIKGYSTTHAKKYYFTCI